MKISFNAQKNGSLIDIILNNQPQLNYSILKTLLRKKDVKVNGKKVNQNLQVGLGDLIELFLPNKKPKQIKIVYEDDNVLIVVKPAGIETTLKDKTFDKTECLEEILNYTACHRLDKNTEGLVVLAKNEASKQQILNAFKTGNIFKKYLTLTYGKPKQNTQNLVAYLVKDSQKNIVTIYDTPVTNSVKILTNFIVLKQIDNFSLLQVELLTGKTHQIRAHLAHIGLSVLGDDKYGNKQINKQLKIKKQCLCAYYLKFNFKKDSLLNYLNNKEFKIEPTFSLDDIKIAC